MKDGLHEEQPEIHECFFLLEIFCASFAFFLQMLPSKTLDLDNYKHGRLKEA